MYYVYLLESKKYDEIYVGSTNDLCRRLKEHNDGKEISTKRYMPWLLVSYEAYQSEKDARYREKMLKQHGNAMRQFKIKSQNSFIKKGVLPSTIFLPKKNEGLPSTIFLPKKNSAGFTLIELLIVIAIIAVMATVVFVALNPLQRFKDARNSVRQQNISAILSAIKINQVDNRGNYLESIRNITEDFNYMIGTATSGCDTGCTASTTQSSCVDLTGLVTAGYIRQIPIESNGGTSAKTLYYLNRASTGVVNIGACMLEVEGESASVSWNCGDMLTDSRDGQTYTTVLVGSQCWMAEHLNYGTMTAGTNQQGSDCSSVAETEKYCYGNIEGNCTTDGALYQWAQMMCGAASCNGTGESQPACASPVQGICPTGWHIPSHYEYIALEREICDSGTCATNFPYSESVTGWRGTNEGGQMKGTTICGTYPCWDSPNTGATNSSGFTIWSAGYRHMNNGLFYSRGSYTSIWSSSESNTNNARKQFLYSGSAAVSWDVSNKLYGFSVRCLKD